MRYLALLRAAVAVAPYMLFLFLVLSPAALVAYALAALVSTVWANLKTGWKEHR